MAVHILQVTIGAGVTQLSATNTPCYQVMIQNNAAHTMRLGDSTTTSSKGALLASGSPGGSINVGPFTAYNTNLIDWWVAGTQNDVVDVVYVQ